MDDLLREYLSAAGIQSGIHYGLTLPEHPYLAKSGVVLPCPVAKRISREVMSLPCYPGLTTEQQGAVIRCCREWLANDA